jgi:hypothetical protein
MATSVEVADIFRCFGSAYRAQYGGQMPLRHHRAMRAIEICRTAALGGHVEQCDTCGALHMSYNSCRNRHCPKCQNLATLRWVEARKKDVLPIRYFHVVFTLPTQLRDLTLRNQRVMYNLLFKAASQTLLDLGEDPKYLGAQIGVIALLHTWTQTLLDHPHLHCLATGGGLSFDGQYWIGVKKRRRKRFLVPVKVLSRLFRGKFLALLKTAYEQDELVFAGQIAHLQSSGAFNRLLDKLYQMAWVVYCKSPLGGAEQVIDYLSRYTHRVGISNDRIISLEGDQVTFSYRDRAEGNRRRLMPLPAFEFIRRFLLHILPEGFVRIRYYGLCANRHRKSRLKQAQKLLHHTQVQSPECLSTWQALLYRLTGVDVRVCSVCGKGRMVKKEILYPHPYRAPPQDEMK